MRTASKIIRTYSGLADIPSGTSSTKVTEGCLVLEGGAWRGIYTEGALDYLLQQDINFKSVIGVSAGAMSGMTYMSGQIGWAARFNLSFRRDQDYCGFGAMKRDRGITGFSFVFQDAADKYGLDKERICDPGRLLTVVATDCRTGEAHYFTSRNYERLAKMVQASATVPYVSLPVMIDGVPYLDGGIACNIPFAFARNGGFRKIVVIRTRDRSFSKEPKEHRKLNEIFYRQYPKICEQLENSGRRYNDELRRLDELEEKGEVFVLAPSRPLDIGRFESDMEILGKIYWLGYHDMQAHFDELKAYLDK